MRKSIFVILFGLILTGCLNSDTEPVTKPVIEPITEPEPVVVEILMSPEEAKELAKDYLMNMDEYIDSNGYHIEEIDTKQLGCSACYEVSYEFRMRDDDSEDIIGTADVTITITDGEISEVMYWDDMEGEEKSLPIQNDSEPVGLPNPASVYCEENGGTLEMREKEAGTYGVCIFPDGSECEEWAYFRDECQP